MWLTEEWLHRSAGAAAEPGPLLLLVAAGSLLTGAAAFLGARWLPRRLATGLAVLGPAALAVAYLLPEGLPREGRPITVLGAGAALATVLGALLAASRRARIGAWLACAATALPLLAGVALAWLPGPPRPPRGDRPDVVLLVMDTTRRDRLSVYGFDPRVSPALARLAPSAAVYEDAWSVSPWTPPSHASIFSGLLPAEHGADGSPAPELPGGFPILPEILRDAGYRTAAFPANPNLTGPGWDRGYDRFRPPWYRGAHGLVRILDDVLVGSPDPWHADRLTRRTLDLARDFWESHADAPRFLFINVLDPHRPYAPPPGEFSRFLPAVSRAEAMRVDQDPVSYHLHPGMSERDRAIVSRLYEAEVASMDREIGAFLDWLAERGDLDRTLLVLTADHGERLGERGLVGHDLVMDPVVLRVPLLIRLPGAVPSGRIARRVQLDGIPGEILRLAGVPAPSPMAERALDLQDGALATAQYESPGWFVERMAHRQPSFDPAPFLGDAVLIAGERSFFVGRTRPDGTLAGSLHDLDADPAAERDLSAERPAELARLRAAAEALPRFAHAAPAAIGAAERERLRSLGYVN